MIERKFSELCRPLGPLPAELHLGGDPVVHSVSADSRTVGLHSLFVCMPSASRDTHEFLPDVVHRGAVAAIVHSPEGLALATRLGIAALLVEPVGSRFNFVVGRLCQAIFVDPTSRMRVVGVTGTNGKTTTAWMMRNALVAMGRRSAYLGTLGFQTEGEMRVLNNTTPFPVELWNLLSEAEAAGVQDFIMESSSHALYERRLAGVQYDVGLLTNFTQDHLDFHGTMEAYAAAKLLLFTEYAAANGKPFTGALNIADPLGESWARELPCRVLTYGRPDADLVTEALDVRVDGIRLRAKFRGETAEMNLQVGGLFNVENAGSALAGLLALGHALEEAGTALEQVMGVPGRFEAIANDRGIGVIVDYAHTPDALDLLLKSARALSPRRIITVFGCGGDRDRSKRPKMAAVVSKNSDVSVVTSDNPRTEDPSAILRDVAVGLQAGAESVQIIDRREAIDHAIDIAEPGDLVVIAGKGHEDYQIIGRTKHPMDDRQMARDALTKVRG